MDKTATASENTAAVTASQPKKIDLGKAAIKDAIAKGKAVIKDGSVLEGEITFEGNGVMTIVNEGNTTGTIDIRMVGKK